MYKYINYINYINYKLDKVPAKENSEAVATNLAKEGGLSVFVGGFPFEKTKIILREDFEKCGAIAKVVIPKDTEGKRKGIAYITFKTLAGVDAACKFDGIDYGGRRLMVNKVGPVKKGKGDRGKGKDGKGKGGSQDG